MLTDSHCHLASSQFANKDLGALIARAQDAEVTRLITLATDEEDQQKNLQLAQDHPQVFACLGIHPCHVHEVRDDFESLIAPHLAHPKVAAIGETGLDYFHPAPSGWSNEDYHQRQRDFLRRHFELAKTAKLNVVIHTRDRSGNQSFEDALTIYQDYASEVQAVFHCFPGPPELASQVFEAGGLISFTGIATFKNAQAVVDTVKAAPAGKFMLETDSPYLAPVPHRGKRCEPAFVRNTAEAVAHQRGISLKQLAEETEKVVDQFFRS